MNLSVGPIMSALVRSRAGSVLVVLQVAIALVVLANGACIVQQRIAALKTTTGIDDQNIFVISSLGFTKQFNYETSVRDDLAYLRGLAGVVAASPADGLPFSQAGFTTDMWTNSEQKGRPEALNAFSMDEQAIEALGTRVSAGRGFRAEEIQSTVGESSDSVAEIIVTKASAEALFKGQDALGRTVYDSLGKPAVIVGILDNLIGSAIHGLSKADHVALFPRMPEPSRLVYVVRTKAGMRDGLMLIAERHLASSNPGRVIKYVRPLQLYKQRLYLADSNMAIFMITAVVLVLLTTCLGIFGLATFNVSTRTRQIGIRRALGARQGDILTYFMVENGLLTTVGIILGCGLAIGLNLSHSLRNHVPPLQWYDIAGSVFVLAAMGQLAAWFPARQASRVAPTVATRAA